MWLVWTSVITMLGNRTLMEVVMRLMTLSKAPKVRRKAISAKTNPYGSWSIKLGSANHRHSTIALSRMVWKRRNKARRQRQYQIHVFLPLFLCFFRKPNISRKIYIRQRDIQRARKSANRIIVEKENHRRMNLSYHRIALLFEED